MDGSFISVFTLAQGSTQISGAVSCGAKTATFTPSSVLANNTTYTATVQAGVKDLVGNAMAAAKTWSFTTAVSLPAAPSSITAGMVYRIMNPDTDMWEYFYGAKWTDQANNENGFVLERATTTSACSAATNWSAPIMYGAVSGTGLTVIYIDQLTPGTTYCYRVRAYKDAGYSGYAWSNAYTR